MQLYLTQLGVGVRGVSTYRTVVYIYIYIYICVCVCVGGCGCVCVSGRRGLTHTLQLYLPQPGVGACVWVGVEEVGTYRTVIYTTAWCWCVCVGGG